MIPNPNPSPIPNPNQARCNGALAVIRLLQRYGTSPTPLAVATVWLRRAIAAAPEDARLLALLEEAKALLLLEEARALEVKET